jgi:hypothetical protein
MNPNRIFTSSLILFFYVCVYLSLGLFPFVLSANLFAYISIPTLAVCPVIFIHDFFIIKRLVMQPKIIPRDTTSLQVRHIRSDNVLKYWFQAYQMRGNVDREGDLWINNGRMGVFWTICNHLVQWTAVRKIKINMHEDNGRKGNTAVCHADDFE